jgi:predicted Zn-dependent peptidase
MKSAKTQLKARLVFDNDSVTNIAHQLGYYETIASVDVFLRATPSIEAVTLEQVAAVAARMLGADNRTVGWFDPLPVTDGESAGNA